MFGPSWAGALRAQWPATPFDLWSSRLHAICGRFEVRPARGRRFVRGAQALSTQCGVEIASVAADIDCVSRSARDARLDPAQKLFLIFQIEGACGVEQNDRREKLEAGDCVLIDSDAPSHIHFGGERCSHLSVHLPRGALLCERAPLDIGRRIGRDDPLASVLLATAVKLRQPASDSSGEESLRGLLHDAVRHAFARSSPDPNALTRSRVSNRLELARLLVDRHLTDPRLDPQWLAARVGVSLRSLQRDFDALGHSVTTYIRRRRLDLVCERLSGLRRGDGGIADIALACGFNDVSYFNRSFREAFGCAPREFMQREKN